MKTLGVAIALAGLLASAVPVVAHHSFSAQYDVNKQVSLKGVVTRVEWTNPHARFYLDVKDATGAVTNWNLELASPNVLRRNGWTRTSLNQGDQVIVDGTAARDGSKVANARLITLADGRQISGGSLGGEAAPPATR